MPPRPGAWGVSAIPTASVALSVGMLGVMALQLSHPHAAKTKASERSGMELRLESSALRDGIDATAQFFKTQRMVACCGDRLTLACQLLIVLVRETQAVVQEAMQAYADAVI